MAMKICRRIIGCVQKKSGVQFTFNVFGMAGLEGRPVQFGTEGRGNPVNFCGVWKMLILWEIGVWRAAEGRGSLKVVVGMRAAGVMF
jgi:hypothetical protein